MSRTSGERLIEDFCDAWARLDCESVLDFFTEDAVYHNVPMAPCTGKAEIRKFLEEFMATVTTGVKPDGGQIDPESMPWELYANFDEEELEAVHLYLQTLMAQ